MDKNIIPSYIRDIFPDKRCNASSYREILKTILYQNVAYNCIKLLLFQLLLVNGLPQERDAPSFKTFSQKIKYHVNEINNNHPSEYF